MEKNTGYHLMGRASDSGPGSSPWPLTYRLTALKGRTLRSHALQCEEGSLEGRPPP